MSTNWRHYSLLDNYWDTSYELWRDNDISLLQCARQCNDLGTCMSFFYHTTDRMCSCASTDYNNSSGLVYWHNMTYYKGKAFFFFPRFRRWFIRLQRFDCTSRKHVYIILTPLKPHFYIVKLGFTGVYIIFLISAQNVDCWYLLEPPR